MPAPTPAAPAALVSHERCVVTGEPLGSDALVVDAGDTGLCATLGCVACRCVVAELPDGWRTELGALTCGELAALKVVTSGERCCGT